MPTKLQLVMLLLRSVSVMLTTLHWRPSAWPLPLFF